MLEWRRSPGVEAATGKEEEAYVGAAAEAAMRLVKGIPAVIDPFCRLYHYIVHLERRIRTTSFGRVVHGWSTHCQDGHCARVEPRLIAFLDVCLSGQRTNRPGRVKGENAFDCIDAVGYGIPFAIVGSCALKCDTTRVYLV
jgi:hypothetical protein